MADITHLNIIRCIVLQAGPGTYAAMAQVCRSWHGICREVLPLKLAQFTITVQDGESFRSFLCHNKMHHGKCVLVTQKEGKNIRVEADYYLGQCVGWLNIYQDGNLIKRQLYETERLSCEETYRKGKLRVVRTYHDNPEQPKAHCTDEHYYPSGQKETRVSGYIDGENFVIDGELCYWHENGILNQQFQYKKGKREGMCREWDANGRLFGEIEYQNGEMHGINRLYGPDGKPFWNHQYRNGFIASNEDGSMPEPDPCGPCALV